MDEHNYDVAGQRLVEAAHYIETLLRVLPPRIKNFAHCVMVSNALTTKISVP